MRYLFILISQLVIQNLTAQTDSTWFLKPVEITATRFNRFAVGQTQIDFDSATLSRFQHQSVADLLRQSTPLSIKSYGAGLATISMRGTGVGHTALLWNGFDIRPSMSATTDLSILPNVFEQMSVKSGGCSALFGCGAIGGSIYFDSNIRQKQGFHGQINASTGSYNFGGQNIDLSLGNGKVAASLKVLRQKAENDFTFRNVAEIGRPLQKQANAAFEKTSVLGSFYAKINEKQVLKTHIWWQHADHQVPNTMTARNDNARQDEHATRFSTEWQRVDNQHITKVRAAYFDENLLYLSDVIDSSKNRMLNAVLEAEHNIDFQKWGSLRVGVNTTQQKVESNNFDGDKARSRFTVFASQMIDFQRIKLALNLRQEMTDGQLTPFTYSLGAEKRLSKAFLLRGSFSRNYNLPTLNDLYWDQLGNPNLKAEKGFSEEIGVDYAVKQSVFSLTVFNMNVDNWIQWSPQSSGIWRPSNLKNVWSRGIETTVKTAFSVKNVSFKAQIGYQLSRATDDLSPKEQLLYTPIHSANATISAHYKQFSMQWLQNFSNKRPMTTDGTLFTEGFTLSNTHFNFSQKLGKYGLNAGFKVQNLWNTDYQTIQYYASPRRNFLVDIGFLF